MSQGKEVPLGQALEAVERLLAELGPLCERIEVAGSVRREKPTIRDIDLVAIPRFEERTPPGEMFRQRVNVLTADWWNKWLWNRPHAQAGTTAKRLYFTVSLKLLLTPHGEVWEPSKAPGFVEDVELPVEIYMVTPETWGVMLAIRTGPAEFSHRLVSNPPFGFLQPGCWIHAGRLRAEHGLVHETPEEEDFLKLCSCGVIHPAGRDDYIADLIGK